MLIMRSALATETSDLTAAARIVDAALVHIAEHGVTAATVRSIAATAGVSPALVLHHFGSKSGLRAACDQRVVAFVSEKSRGDGALDEAFARYGAYAARVLADDADGAAELFDVLVTVARDVIADGVTTGRLRASADADALAVAIVTLGLAPFTFRGALARWAGGDDEAALTRLGVPLAELYTRGLYTEGSVLDRATEAQGRAS